MAYMTHEVVRSFVYIDLLPNGRGIRIVNNLSRENLLINYQFDAIHFDFWGRQQNYAKVINIL